MHNLILSFLITLCFASSAFAIPDAKVYPLRNSSTGAIITDLALTSGVAVNSEGVYVADNIGYTVLLVTEDKSGGAGDVDIYAEYSTDNTNWYRPYTSDMAGTLTVEGNIVTTLQNSTRYIIFTPRLAKYMRLVFDPDADSEITATLIFQRER